MAGRATRHSPNVRGFLAGIGRPCNRYLVVTQIREAGRSLVATDSPGEISGSALPNGSGPATATTWPNPAVAPGLDRIHSPAAPGP